DVLAVHQDAPGRGRKDAGEQVDQRGLAGAVGADQGMAGALRDRERDAVGRGDAAEAAGEVVRLQHDRRHDRLQYQVHGRSSRSRPTITSTTRKSPSQKVQYCGVMVEKMSCRNLNATAPRIPP